MNVIEEIINIKKVLQRCPYDVGDIYITANDTNPNDKWQGTSWERCNGVYSYSPKANLIGTTWKFNDILSRELFPDSYQEKRCKINFTDLNGDSYTELAVQGNQTPPERCAIQLVYKSSQYGDMSVYEDHYILGRGWMQEQYKTITITGGDDTMDEWLYEFLSESAILIDGTISYDYPLGSTIEAGLPNITGQVSGLGGGEPKFGTPSGALTSIGTVNYYSNAPSVSGYTRYDGFGFDASGSNSIYGNSDTVRPRSFVANMWKRIG